MSRILNVCLALGLLLALAFADEKTYKMCVPHRYYENCVTLLKEPSQAGLHMECVSGRDRMECLEKVNKHEADFLAVDPEDMYVAYHMNNQNFQVISEIRTQVEKDAEFRYEGIILVKKGSDIHSLQDLRGRKSCHTGFGRNVGYKIPITKLKNLGIFKVSSDPNLSPAERELKALSEFFTESCLVGTYSPYPELDKELKRKYPNLCARCEKPEQCNYPDIYSGYEGAIRCLVENHGDVAFTKTSFVKKYFDLLSETPKPFAANYEYLCEDGSRRPITGPPCSWAQRPWQGYMSTRDVVGGDAQLHRLQERIDSFYTNAQKSPQKELAAPLLIKDVFFLHERKDTIQPKEYLEHAGYKDVIERDGSVSHKIRLCVNTDAEMQKCDTMKRAAYSRDIRPEFECFQHPIEECVKMINEQEADVIILTDETYNVAKEQFFEPLIFDSFADDNIYVAMVDADLTSDKFNKEPIEYDETSVRARHSAHFFNILRGLPACTESHANAHIKIVKASELPKYHDKKIICSTMEVKEVTEYKTCHIEATYPNAAFGRSSLPVQERNNIIHAFTLVSERFGPTGWFKDVFEIFDEFLPNHPNVLFHDDAVALVKDPKVTFERVAAMHDQLTCH